MGDLTCQQANDLCAFEIRGASQNGRDVGPTDLKNGMRNGFHTWARLDTSLEMTANSLWNVSFINIFYSAF